ncbi:MAG: leucine--tRNA ligase [Patescibacteria group bacterium]|nr:leucine--tRNA ligase [Patescibacteria group bacterium]
MAKAYNPQKIEKKWQKVWETKKFSAAKDFDKRKKFYALVEFPYPSGDGLHVGHVRSYSALDAVARWKRMSGFNVLYPIGFDAFGLPTENYAIKNKIHPRVATDRNIKTFTRQLKSIGLSFDWSRMVDTTDPKYYKWTQWIFLQLYKAGLAYRGEIPINWCPKCKTGLANEEVIAGRHERCGTVVTKKLLKQWVIKITKYADRLLADLSVVDYPERVKTQQINWIGKSEGAEIDFEIWDEAVKRFVILHCKGGSPQSYFYPWLKSRLEALGYEVEVPDLPNPEAPNDLEQAEYVSQHCKLDENTVLVGHSSGGHAVLRLLEQDRKVRKAVLIATPTSGKFLDGQPRPTVLDAITRGFDYEKIRRQCQDFTVLADTHDYAVPLSDNQALARHLDAKYLEVKAAEPHFLVKKETQVFDAVLPRLRVFTTRPDTLFGATYMVVAPEHPVVAEYLKHKSHVQGVWNAKEVADYVEAARKKTDIARSAEDKDPSTGSGQAKTGVELKGLTVKNPLTGEFLPVWTADYVMMGYGTGAIMAVPAHDERDFAFAKKYRLPIKPVIKPPDVATRDNLIPESGTGHLATDLEAGCWIGEGTMINSGPCNGLPSSEGRKKITETLEQRGLGQKAVSYKLRDWVFSRQHYWGEPIPVIHCEDCGEVPVPEKDLPVLLPKVKNYEPTETGESPLSAIKSFVNVKCPKCKGPAHRETDTMPNWAGSNWYFIRYTDSKNARAFADRKKMDYWLPVDLYNGGMEHTTLHLLYSRFVYKFLFDQGLVPEPEPYKKRTSHGIILAADGRKMSKSFGNVVNPDSIVKEYGADTLRLYEMFIAPFDQMVPWAERGVIGVQRFLERLWKFYGTNDWTKKRPPENSKVQKFLHKLIAKITSDLTEMKFNTAVAAFMETLNALEGEEMVSRKTAETYLVLLAPFAPHIAEELWRGLGNKSSVHQQSWPAADEKYLTQDTLTLAVAVNGKVRDTLEVPSNMPQNEVENLALDRPKVAVHLKGKTIVRTVFVPGKMVNFVVK